MDDKKEKLLNLLNKDYAYFKEEIKKFENLKEFLTQEDLLEKIANISDNSLIMSYLCETGGIEFCLKAIDLQNCTLKEKAQEYFYDLLDRGQITPELWKKLNKETKYHIINKVLADCPYNYDELIRNIRCDMEHPRMKQRNITMEPKLIMPSEKLSKLIAIVDSSKDKEFKKYIESFLKAYSENIIYPHYPPDKSTFYFLDENEKELIRRAILVFKNNGYLMKSMPNILLSYEDPPFFILYPHLIEKEEQKSSNEIDEVPRQKSNEQEIFYDTELLLGIYKIYPQNHIVLYEKGIEWCAKKLKLDYEYLKWNVLVHEIGHWITHTFYKDNWEGWEDSRYLKTEENVHEGWAQLIAYWVIKSLEKDNKNTHDELINVFEKLKDKQREPYKKYEEFKKEDKSKVINTLKDLRSKVEGAKFSEWKEILNGIKSES